ncbi:hypothetical protein KIPB_014031, partial [Kipferlia bialata]
YRQHILSSRQDVVQKGVFSGLERRHALEDDRAQLAKTARDSATRVIL